MHGLELWVCPTGFETCLKFSPGVGHVPQWSIYTLTLNVIAFRLLIPYWNEQAHSRPGNAPRGRVTPVGWGTSSLATSPVCRCPELV